MNFLVLAVVLFSQYVNVYTPHEPWMVESGAVVVPRSLEMEVAYRSTDRGAFLSTPFLSELAFSPDGYNEAAIQLPWVRVASDTATHYYLGNTGIYYKRRILASIKWGYVSARATADFPTSRDTFGIEDSLGGNRSFYGADLSYTYELALRPKESDFLGRMPVVASLSLGDRFLCRNHDAKDWEADFGSNLYWGASLEILPTDYGMVGAALAGTSQGVNFSPYLGFRWFWWEVGAAYHLGRSAERLDLRVKLYL